jgi:spermidine/putrescine transport system permease protein
VLAFFNSGPTSITFPIRVYSMIRFGVTPEINAIAAIVMAFSLLLVFVALRLTRRRTDQLGLGSVL